MIHTSLAADWLSGAARAAKLASVQAESWRSGVDICVPYVMLWGKAKA